MKLFKAEQMRRADRAATEAGIALALLMESAGRQLAELARNHWPETVRVLILCGKGNNGGDGYVAARHLHLAGKQVSVLELAGKGEMTTEEGEGARTAWQAHSQLSEKLASERVKQRLEETDLVIDALFGSGLTRPLAGELEAVVNAVNASGKPVLSVDVPSGVPSDGPGLIGPHIEASYTLQLAGPKLSSVLSPAAEAFGEWSVADIGIPKSILELEGDVESVTKETLIPWLPRRGRDVHKYSAGTVLIVAGSTRYLGAAELAARAAYRAGAGLVTLAAEARLPDSWPEIIFERLEWDGDPLKTLANLDPKRAQVRVIGPGLDDRAQPFLPDLIAQSDVPTVLDAGALVAGDEWHKAVKAQGRCVLTPHAGEAARLLACSSNDVTADPVGSTQRLAEHYGAVAVLKGASTVIAAPGGRVALSTSGHPGMATGGSGDVLSGMVGAWLAHSDTPFERSAAAVYLHGLAGERAAQHYGDGLVASDLVDAFARVWRDLV